MLLHVEVQGGRLTSLSVPNLTLRIQQYDYRIHDRYVLQPALDNQQTPPANTVYTLVILTHSVQGSPYLLAQHQALHTPARLRYAVVHLGQWLARWQELEALARTNPFAILIQAQLLAQRHRRADRMQPKLALVHRLLASGYSRGDVVSLLRLVDWLLTLPADLEAPYVQALGQLQKETAMTFVTSYERVAMRKGEARGIEIGKQQALQDLIEIKFGSVPDSIVKRIQQADSEQIQRWMRRTLNSQSVAELFAETD
ncbi:MAG: hypothetical protein AB7E55_06590 [Pigmentiphaga sp.]